MGIRNLKRAVFLDKDGVLNKVLIRDGKIGSPRNLRELELTEEALEPIDDLKKGGFLVVVLTNQPDLARGRMAFSEFEAMARAVRERFPIDDLLVCPHDDEDACECRKPKPGLIYRACEQHGIDVSRSFFVGDTRRDLEAANRAGCPGLLIDTPYNRDVSCEHRFQNLRDAVKFILEQGDK